MEIISISLDIFNELVAQLEVIAKEAEFISRSSDDYAIQKWLDNQDVCEILNISKRKLQTYRDNGSLPFTQIEKKVYYKSKDVENLLKSLTQKKARYEQHITGEK